MKISLLFSRIELLLKMTLPGIAFVVGPLLLFAALNGHYEEKFRRIVFASGVLLTALPICVCAFSA